tara:strand:+ start:457 stop:576 length:120 start_codon:yes stop_codon:yes gene_type:complete
MIKELEKSQRGGWLILIEKYGLASDNPLAVLLTKHDWKA